MLTDHSPRLTVANGLLGRAAHRAARASSPRSTSTSATGFRLLTGIEVDILDDGALDQTDEMLDRLDVRGRLACTPSCGWTPPR